MNLIRVFLKEWKLKLLLGTVMTVLFWIGYFLLQGLQIFMPHEMPALGVDRWIPFQPRATILYLSQFLMMPFVLAMSSSRRQLLNCCFGVFLIMGVAFTVFFFYPTFVARPGVPLGSYPLYEFLIRVDETRNAFPSLHAAFGVFIGGCSLQILGRGRFFHPGVLMMQLWILGVLASTLLIKQHVVLDLVAGALLGAGVLILKWRDLEKRPS